jgi:prefoldin subunit 5
MERIQKRKEGLQRDLEKREKEIKDISDQIGNAQNIIRQRMDSALIVRGQILELDTQIDEYKKLDEQVEEEKTRRGKKSDKSEDKSAPASPTK